MVTKVKSCTKTKSTMKIQQQSQASRKHGERASGAHAPGAGCMLVKESILMWSLKQNSFGQPVLGSLPPENWQCKPAYNCLDGEDKRKAKSHAQVVECMICSPGWEPKRLNFLKDLVTCILCMGVLSECMYVYHVYAWRPWRHHEGVRYPEAKVTQDSELLL